MAGSMQEPVTGEGKLINLDFSVLASVNEADVPIGDHRLDFEPAAGRDENCKRLGRRHHASSNWTFIRLAGRRRRTLDRDLPLRPIVVQAKTYGELLVLSSQQALFQIGYGMERPFSETVASPCQVGRQAGGAFAFECLSNHCYSGAPILTGPVDSVVMIGIVSRRSVAGPEAFVSALSDLDEPVKNTLAAR
jgi:hypothetical protein